MIHHLIILSGMASPAYSDEDPYESYLIPLIHSTNFLTMISTLSRDIRNDGSGRKLIPFTDPELNIRYNLISLRANSKKAAALHFLTNQ